MKRKQPEIDIDIIDELNSLADLAATMAEAATGMMVCCQPRRQRRIANGLELMAWDLSDRIAAVFETLHPEDEAIKNARARA